MNKVTSRLTKNSSDPEQGTQLGEREGPGFSTNNLQRDIWHWLLWIIAVLPVCWRQITTSDLWWHVALGRWLAENRSLPDYSRFYFTPVNPQVEDLRWSALGDLLLYVVHSAGGAAAVQALSFLCLILGCYLLRRLYAGPMNGWVTALLILVAWGTYQLQLPRNAMFSLPLTALVFWLFHTFRLRRRLWLALLFPAVVGLWSVLHGSYLLGCVLVGILFVSDAFASWRLGPCELARRMGLAVAVVALTLLLVTPGNPSAVKMLRRPFEVVLGVGKPERAAAKRAAKAAAKEARDKPQSKRVVAVSPGLAHRLNNLIWVHEPGQIQSGEFSSPFERFSYRPVIISFVLMTLGIVWLLWGTWPPSLPWLSVFAATSLLGVSYFRMTGYAAMGAAVFILTSPPLRGVIGQELARRGTWGLLLAGMMAIMVWSAYLRDSLPALVGNSRHVFRTGKVATFDDAACQWLLDHHRERRVFTTIVTGSYALHQWQGQKQVFVDGFFAPHPPSVWRDYGRARRRLDKDLLREGYGVDLALIEHGRTDWNKLFLNLPDWQPIAIGLGTMVYGHRAAVGDAEPRLLFTAEQAEELPSEFRRDFAQSYYAALLALLAADRPEAAQRLADAASTGHRRWRKLLSRNERKTIAQIDRALGLRAPTEVTPREPVKEEQ